MSKQTDFTSIIIPCCNQADFTRQCAQALFRFTRPPWELIVVDNGSTDETRHDLAVRARKAGFALAVAGDLFIHHFGSRTFVGNAIDAERILEENGRKFAEKWGLDGLAGQRVALRPWGGGARSGDGREEFHAELRGGSQSYAEEMRKGAETPAVAWHRRKARVSLTMIVRDEEENLPRCLGSMRGVFDEIVVVDTGSTDRTREIARDFGARVFDFVRVDDFAAARNAALARCTGDYAFWLDADDVIEPPEREKLIALLEGLGSPAEVGQAFQPDSDRSDRSDRSGRSQAGKPDLRNDAGGPAAYVVKCACDPGEDGSGGHTVVDHIRLFPVRETIRWTYRVHEQILPALRRAGVPARWTDLTVRHTGYSSRAVRARKLERDTRILRPPGGGIGWDTTASSRRCTNATSGP